jgi:hypothetical protein
MQVDYGLHDWLGRLMKHNIVTHVLVKDPRLHPLIWQYIRCESIANLTRDKVRDGNHLVGEWMTELLDVRHCIDTLIA